jgi:DNA-binding response OmpR family regulator/signal transduction histidine kinase
MAKGKRGKSDGKVAAQRAKEAPGESDTHPGSLSVAGRPGRTVTDTQSLRTIGNLGPGDHLCCLYETEEEHRAVLTPFLRQGLERGEKVLYIVDARTAETVLGYLRDDGLDPESYLASGQLTILTADDAYLKEGVFDPEGMIALLRVETEQALGEGYAALRVTGEMSWALRELPGSERLIEYEAKLNEFFPGSKCLAICQYDRRAFDPELLLDVLSTHPAAVVGAEVYDNFYYMPPAEFLSHEPRAAQLRHWVENLAERKRVVETTRLRTHELGERVKELNCLYEISRLVERLGTSLEGILQGTVELIPPAWQYPEVTCARITLQGQEFRTENFRESDWRQTADIVVLGQRTGVVEVCYLEERPRRDEGPFLKEERSLINAIAERLARVTERRLTEEVIREQGVFLQTILDALGHPFYVIDAKDYTIKMANAAARLGPLPEATTCYALTHGLSEPCSGDEHVCPLQVVKETKAPVTVEHTHRDADGNDRPVEVHCHPVLDDEGNVKQVIEYTLDITERRRAEEELERLRREFLGMVTHELKTPLTAIKGSAATALGSRRPFGEQENRELFQIVDEQADRLRELVDNLLDMTRIEAGSLSVSPEPTDLREVLEEARATFVHSGGSHRIQLELPADLPAVAADRHRVVQVLTNLLNNAARFSPATELITIAGEHDPLGVTVHVRDRGQGISREKLSRLFKKFSQVHDDTGQKLSGTGLGLAICKGIVEAHGGRISVDSAGEGQGSTFSFTLPVATETRVTSLSDEARRTLHMGRVRRPGERTRVLAVDDEPQVLRYLQRSLDEAGYQPIVTSDPSQAAKLAELEEPDVVLLDLRLPGISGFDLLQRIREFSGVPVIFLTASDREEDAVRALRMGADDYVTKPFSPSELLARIEAALRRRLLPDLIEARPPFVVGDLTINFAERRVTVGGQDASLSATEYKILYELATHAGRALTYDQLLRRVWGEEYSGETELVRSFIRNLRRKLGDDARHPRFIVTERQVGYRMPKP